MTDLFASLVSPVFQRVLDLLQRVEEGEHPPLGPEREQILMALDEASRKAGSSTQLSHDFELAKHGLVYWIDEVLINSPWTHATEWRQHILEWDIYQERLRADRFYEKAHAAETLAGTDPLETYYLCVALGFRGKFVDQPADLRGWSDRIYNRIASTGLLPDRFLPEETAERSPLNSLPGQSVLLAVSLMVSVTALITLVCFVLAVHPRS